MSTSRQTPRQSKTPSQSLCLPRRLIFIRHAIAIPAEEFDGQDRDRPLTEKGIARAKKSFARILQYERITRILSSPLVRTVATAELVQGALSSPAPKLELCEALAPGTNWKEWYAAFTYWTPSFAEDDCVAIVGHEPSLGELFARHLGHSTPIPFKKAGVGILDPKGMGHGQLVAFIPPRLMQKT